MIVQNTCQRRCELCCPLFLTVGSIAFQAVVYGAYCLPSDLSESVNQRLIPLGGLLHAASCESHCVRAALSSGRDLRLPGGDDRPWESAAVPGKLTERV